MRPARITTLLGPVSLTRAVYACPHGGSSQDPLDRQLQVAVGGLSLGLQELLALLGATQDSLAVHQGQAPALLAGRQEVLDLSYATYPERFVRGRPIFVPNGH